MSNRSETIRKTPDVNLVARASVFALLAVVLYPLTWTLGRIFFPVATMSQTSVLAVDALAGIVAMALSAYFYHPLFPRN